MEDYNYLRPLQHIAPRKSSEELCAAANDGEYAEMICGECANRLPFLAIYQTQSADSQESVCKLTSKSEQISPRSQPLFMPQGWRSSLCRCPSCIVSNSGVLDDCTATIMFRGCMSEASALFCKRRKTRWKAMMENDGRRCLQRRLREILRPRCMK